MITRIEAGNYRCLKNVGIDLPPYAVAVGANGSGKSTLFDVPRILGDWFMTSDINAVFTQQVQGRAPRCMHVRELPHKCAGDSFFFAVEAALPDDIKSEIAPQQNAAGKTSAPNVLRYEVLFVLDTESRVVRPGRPRLGLHVQIAYEYLCWRTSADSADKHDGMDMQGQNEDVRKTRRNHLFWREEEHRLWVWSGQEPFSLLSPNPSTSGVAAAAYSRDALVIEWFRQLLQNEYLFYQPDVALLKKPAPLGLPTVPMSSAANLPQLALALARDDAARYALWQEHVQSVFPNIVTIEAREREVDHHAYFRVTYRDGHVVTSPGLSEGTLRFMALTILPYLNDLQRVVFVEEPENGIHPGAIQNVLQSLTSAYNSRVVISTHSPVVLSNSRLEQVLCIRRGEDGETIAYPGTEHPQLKDHVGPRDLGMFLAGGILA